jgi:arylamine N-acetyltransferase
MSVTALSNEHRRYLRLLGVAAAPPDFDALRQIVGAHVCRVPFENVSKLLLYAREGAGRPITLTEFLDGIEHHDHGGTCYSSNPFLCGLLRALGYDATLLSADMQVPDIHSSIRVRLDGVEYHIDVGYAAPFRSPMPLDRLPHTVTSGAQRYVFDGCDRPDTYELTLYIRGERRHGYVVHPPPRGAGFFNGAILNSFRPGSTFMRCLRISRIFDDRTIDIRNRSLIVSRSDSSAETTLDSVEDLRDAVSTVLMMPRCAVEEAVRILERLMGQSFFGARRWADSLD